jgi:hypothetical protein
MAGVIQAQFMNSSGRILVVQKKGVVIMDLLDGMWKIKATLAETESDIAWVIAGAGFVECYVCLECG